MASNLKAQLEKCIGNLDGKGIFQIIDVTASTRGEDEWILHAKLAEVMEDIKILVSAEDDGHRIRLQVSFMLKGYDALDKTRCLDVANQINREDDRVSRVFLVEEKGGMEAFVRIAFGYHPFYLEAQVIDDMVGLFRMNILALMVECTGASTALQKAVARRGKYLS